MNRLLSEICVSARRGSSLHPARFSHTRFKSSVHSSSLPHSALLPGSTHTSSRIAVKISSVVPIPSTHPLLLPWYCALAVSHFPTWLPLMALGELTNILPFSFSRNVKSLNAGITERPPPQAPKTAVICGTTPLAATCFA